MVQMVQTVEPWGANEPGGQQAAAPAYDEVPIGQELHALLSELRTMVDACLAKQRVQAVSTPLMEMEPEGHMVQLHPVTYIIAYPLPAWKP